MDYMMTFIQHFVCSFVEKATNIVNLNGFSVSAALSTQIRYKHPRFFSSNLTYGSHFEGKMNQSVTETRFDLPHRRWHNTSTIQTIESISNAKKGNGRTKLN